MADKKDHTSHKASQDKEKPAVSEEKKLDIEDIKEPENEEPARSEDHSRQNEDVGLAGGDLDIDEVVSELEEVKNMPDEVVDEGSDTEDVPEEIPEEQSEEEELEKDEKSETEGKVDSDQSEDNKDTLEKAVEETETEKVDEEKSKKRPHSAKDSRGKWKTALLILLTILVTAALVLGAVWWYMTRNASQKTEEPKKETKTEEPAKENIQPTSGDIYINAAEGLRLRKEPNPNAEILATMPFGTKLTPLDKSGDWIKVEYQGKTGWCLSTYTSNENPFVYKNTEYGFQITFPETWAGYKFFEKNIDGVIVLYLGLPTTQVGWTSTGVDAGYSSMFAIDVYTKAQWATANAGEGPKPVKLGEKGDYVYTWSQAQATPTDLDKRFAEIKSVIDTFQII